VKGVLPYCVGIAGGTGSGKTTLAYRLQSIFGPEQVTVLEADYYYRDLSHMPAQERHRVNFDHPVALDIELMAAHLRELRQGRAVRMNVYDFTTHCRTDAVVSLEPRPLILVEGILVLSCPAVSDQLDLKVYINEDADVRRERRLQRDVRERGRAPEMSALQYERDVLPMHARYVEPALKDADIVLSSSADTDRLLSVLRAALATHSKNAQRSHTDAS
jgi:uridine kinase